jgi:hypothetical protein
MLRQRLHPWAGCTKLPPNKNSKRKEQHHNARNVPHRIG